MYSVEGVAPYLVPAADDDGDAVRIAETKNKTESYCLSINSTLPHRVSTCGRIDADLSIVMMLVCLFRVCFLLL